MLVHSVINNGSTIMIGLLIILLLAAAIIDMSSYTIPNWLNGAVVILSLPYWYFICRSTGTSFLSSYGIQLGLAFVTFSIFAVFFALGVMGGGDVKLLAALALWFPWLAFLKLLVLISVFGGLVTFVYILAYKMQKQKSKLTIPYGIAISLGGIFVQSRYLVNTF